MQRSMVSVWRDKAAVTSVEYGLLAALLTLAIISSEQVLGTDLAALFQRITTAL